MFDAEITALATTVLAACRQRGWTVATVESCTGGLVSGALTAIAGSSDVVNGGLVTYANAAKTALAHVPETLLAEHGAVSEPVASAMAVGGRERLAATLAVRPGATRARRRRCPAPRSSRAPWRRVRRPSCRPAS